MDDSQRSGERIRIARNSKGWTQQQLATAARVSKSMVAKVETGHASASNAWIGSVARALGVDVGYLTGHPYVHGVDARTAVHQLIPNVRRALASWDLAVPQADLPPADLTRLAYDVEQLQVWRHDTNYQKIGATLPGVLQQLLVAAQDSDDVMRGKLYSLLTLAYRAANTMAHKLGYTDLSLTALDRMEWASQRSEDPLLVAIVDYVRAGALTRIGSLREALLLLERAGVLVRDNAQDSDPRSRQAVMGCLHMKAIAISGALADRDGVETHMAEASRFADDLGGEDKLVYETPFGPSNIQLHALSAYVDLGEPGEAIAIGDEIRLPKESVKERATYYWTDRARAYLLNAQPDRAVEALYEARAAAPLHFANSSVVRGTIQSIASRQRRSTSTLRALAQETGIED